MSLPSHSFFENMVHKYGKNYKCLEYLMSHLIPRETTEIKHACPMKVSIFSNNTDGPLYTFPVHRWPIVDSDNLDRCAHPSARLILVEHGPDNRHLNPAFLGALATRFAMHPAFYAYHFEHFGPGQCDQMSETNNSRMLSFECPFVDIKGSCFGGSLRVSLQDSQGTLPIEEPGDSTADSARSVKVIAFISRRTDSAVTADMKASRFTAISELTDMCARGNVEDPLAVVVPLVMSETRLLSRIVETDRKYLGKYSLSEDPYWSEFHLKDVLNKGRMYRRRCKTLNESLGRFLEHARNQASIENTTLGTLKLELDRINAGYVELSSQAQVALQQLMTQRSLEEANKSIQTAESVRRCVHYCDR